MILLTCLRAASEEQEDPRDKFSFRMSNQRIALSEATLRWLFLLIVNDLTSIFTTRFNGCVRKIQFLRRFQRGPDILELEDFGPSNFINFH